MTPGSWIVSSWEPYGGNRAAYCLLPSGLSQFAIRNSQCSSCCLPPTAFCLLVFHIPQSAFERAMNDAGDIELLAQRPPLGLHRNWGERQEPRDATSPIPHGKGARFAGVTTSLR